MSEEQKDVIIEMQTGEDGKPFLVSREVVRGAASTGDREVDEVLSQRSAAPLPGQNAETVVRSAQRSNLTQLEQFHIRIIELILDGIKPREISQHLGIAESVIHDIAATPLFQAEMSRRRSERDKVLDQVAGVRRGNAIRTLEDALELAAKEQVGLLHTASSQTEKQSAINNIWDKCFGRLGGRSATTSSTEDPASRPGFVINNLNVSVVSQLKEGLKELKQLAQDGLIDAEIVTGEPNAA